MQKKIGLIAGEGQLPVMVAKNARKRGFTVVTVALSRVSRDALSPYSDSICQLGIGQASKIVQVLKNEGVKDLIIIGRIDKKVIFDKLRLDLRAIKFLKMNINQSDNTIMSNVVKAFQEEGIEVLDQRTFLEDLFPDKGVLTKREPTEEEWRNIGYGFSLAKEIARLDIGETVVVKDEAVVAVEAIEGTDEAIRRGCKLAKKNAVVIKVSRKKEDSRLDVPAVGTRTIQNMMNAKASVLALEFGKIFIIDIEEVLEIANSANIAIVMIDGSEKS